jgi:hypothetical protein
VALPSKLIYNNLMWDKRIFRGNTYSAIVISKKNDANFDAQPNPNRTLKPPQETTNAFDTNKRANIEIFTDEFVESLTDKPPRYEYGSQTLPLPENKVIRHRMEPKTGLDTYSPPHAAKLRFGTTNCSTSTTR